MPPPSTNILGTDVPSANPVFLAFLAVHVAAGLTCTLTGAVAALARKGSKRHTRAGAIYFRSLAVVFATATALAVMRWAEDYYLFIIGSIAFAAGATGYLHRKLRRPGDTGHIAGMGLSYIALLTAFYVDNGKNLPLWKDLPHITYWLLPSIVGGPSCCGHCAEAAARNQAIPPPRTRSHASQHGHAPRPAPRGQPGWTVPTHAASPPEAQSRTVPRWTRPPEPTR